MTKKKNTPKPAKARHEKHVVTRYENRSLKYELECL